jgi:hypothetical protein
MRRRGSAVEVGSQSLATTCSACARTTGTRRCAGQDTIDFQLAARALPDELGALGPARSTSSCRQRSTRPRSQAGALRPDLRSRRRGYLDRERLRKEFYNKATRQQGAQSPELQLGQGSSPARLSHSCMSDWITSSTPPLQNQPRTDLLEQPAYLQRPNLAVKAIRELALVLELGLEAVGRGELEACPDLPQRLR